MSGGRPAILAVVATALLIGIGASLILDPRDAKAAVDTGVLLEDLDGNGLEPLNVIAARAHVIVFTTVDCPIANAYWPELRSIANDARGLEVRFFFVHVDPDVDAEVARTHARDYACPGTILLDPRHELVAALGVTITPEVVVVLPGGRVAYQGRIDNLYGDLGRKRLSATTHELRDVLDQIRHGTSVTVPWEKAVGCYVPEI